MNAKQIIERLKPITDRLWWCRDCGRFLQPDEVRYASMSRSNYCTHHIHNNLSDEARYDACVKVVEELVEELNQEQPDE
jgi:hypothetical protein